MGPLLDSMVSPTSGIFVGNFTFINVEPRFLGTFHSEFLSSMVVFIVAVFLAWVAHE